MIEMLVYAYANVDAVDVNGSNPHDYACAINRHHLSPHLMDLMRLAQGRQLNMRKSREFRRVRNLRKNFDIFSLGTIEKESNKSHVQMLAPESIGHIKQFLGDRE